MLITADTTETAPDVAPNVQRESDCRGGQTKTRDLTSDYQDEHGICWLGRRRVWFVCGNSEEYFLNLAGENVATVRIALREVFNIPDTAVALVDGEPVAHDHVVQEGTKLELVEPSE